MLTHPHKSPTIHLPSDYFQNGNNPHPMRLKYLYTVALYIGLPLIILYTLYRLLA